MVQPLERNQLQNPSDPTVLFPAINNPQIYLHISKITLRRSISHKRQKVHQQKTGYIICSKKKALY